MAQTRPSVLSTSHLQDVQGILDRHLRDRNVYDEIRQVVQKYLQEQTGLTVEVEAETKAEATAKLLPAPILNSVLTDLGTSFIDSDVFPPTAAGFEGPFLQVEATAGRAFVSELHDATPSTLTLHIQFGRYRGVSRPVPSAVEPRFGERFLFPLQTKKIPAGPASFLHTSLPLRVFVMRHRVGQSTAELVASTVVEWRSVLERGECREVGELHLNDGQVTVSTGLIPLHLRFLSERNPLPRVVSTSNRLGNLVPSDQVRKVLSTEKMKTEKLERRFRAYVETWRGEFNAVRQCHKFRRLTLFPMTEAGTRQFACRFVCPLKAPRQLRDTLHAARFVQLFPLLSDVSMGGERSVVWSTLSVLLARCAGDVQDHATLLCSLLLGFGLDAYVVVGTNSHGNHAWVATRTTAHSVVLWESLTGERFVAPAEKNTSFPFKEVHCVFNHETFFANRQLSAAADTCDWHLENADIWKCVDPKAIALLPLHPPPALVEFPLRLTFSHALFGQRPQLLDCFAEEQRVEEELLQIVSVYRQQHFQAATHVDEDFGQVLAPALVAFERERELGMPCGEAEFQQAIRHFVKLGSVFKAVPHLFSHTDTSRMLAEMMKEKADACNDLLCTQGDAKFGIRVRVVAFPERVRCVWVMLAVVSNESEGHQ